MPTVMAATAVLGLGQAKLPFHPNVWLLRASLINILLFFSVDRSELKVALMMPD